ncbi:hypothetical protein TNCV_1564361 [Trichonephila clavipes]|nr:hypothetical protein TNCV_1564361 [Trichonephila clavipes]
MRCFPGVPSCEKYMILASPVPDCVRSAVFPDFQVLSARIPECSCVSSINLKGILEEKREEREKREIKKFEERRLAKEFELKCLRAQLSNKLNENELKAWNRINNLANVCILSENRAGEVSEPVNKCRPLINPIVNKSTENATSCDFENENCDPPVRGTNVSLPSEVRGRGTEKNNFLRLRKGKKSMCIGVVIVK